VRRAMIRRIRSEQDGNVLVIAVTMVTLMLALGAGALSTVDTQTSVSMQDRRHESTFNLAEGVLNAQAFVLGRLGTGVAANGGFPIECTQLSTESLCPTPAQVARSYTAATQSDYDSAMTWSTRVRDNPIDPSNSSVTYYDSSAVAAAPRYDANGDRQLWVSATANVRGRTRQIVALIRVEVIPVTFPSYAILSGGFTTSNNGRKVIVDATDPSSLGVGVRCTDATAPSTASTCLGYDPGKGQLDPAGHYTMGYPDTPAIRDDDLQALIDFAKGAGTFYTSCPSNPNGAVVVIESGACSFNNSTPALAGQKVCCNSAVDPGLLIMKCGSLSFGGNIEFYGLVYVPNKASADGSYCSSGNVVTTEGTSLIRGGVIIDGPGRMYAGSSGANVIFDPLAFQGINAAGTAGVVQNTWREVPDEN
jgi:Tfp pilus assembly protein PilX